MEVYDGQWRNMIVQSMNGFPLTKIQLAKRSWDRISKLSREKILNELVSTYKIMLGDRDILQVSPKLQQGETRIGNLLLTHNTNGSLSVESLGGKIYDEGIMCYVYTVHDHDLWL